MTAGPFIIVSGLPASGKSSVGRQLASRFGLTLLDKDDFLEALFDEPRANKRTTARSSLSREADQRLRTAAMASAGAVLVSWWRHPHSQEETGTPTEWLTDLPGRWVEVHLTCPPGLAARRFLQRQRHIGHQDERWSAESLEAWMERHAVHGPLCPDRAIVSNALDASDMAPILAAVASRLP